MVRSLTLMALALAAALALVFFGCNSGGSGSSPTPSDGDPTSEATPPPDSAAGGELDAPDLVETLKPSVVHIVSEAATLDVFGQITPQRGVGTGFIIDEEGHIVTNNHVVTIDGDEPAQDITVTLDDGRQFDAEIAGRDPPTDLAVLKIEASDLTPARLGSSEALVVGEDVLAIGNALDLPGGPTVTRGVVSAKDRLIQSESITIPDAIQTDASINPGNSGGPLLNAQGEVVGITTAVIRGEAEGIGLVIAIDTAKPIIDELIENGQVDRGLLGVTITEITPSLAAQFGLAVEQGVGLQAVQPGAPADDAGLQEGDIIVAMAGEEITNSGELFQALTENRAGDTVTVEFFRGDARMSAEVTLG
ncbi:MAG: trypsin-like peptidase domain-containing protein [Dehalococcoidia bacterium]